MQYPTLHVANIVLSFKRRQLKGVLLRLHKLVHALDEQIHDGRKDRCPDEKRISLKNNKCINVDPGACFRAETGPHLIA